MREKSMHIPGADALNSAVDAVLPVMDEHADMYHGLAGVWIAGGAFASERVVDWLEKANSAPSTAALVGTIAVAAIPTGMSAVFWRQGWRSRGE